MIEIVVGGVTQSKFDYRSFATNDVRLEEYVMKTLSPVNTSDKEMHNGERVEREITKTVMTTTTTKNKTLG
jgi:hypothetical protein